MHDKNQNVVLIVEDDPRNLELLTETLSSANFEVAISTTGEYALEIMNTERPAVILMDVDLPGIDGFETCRRLKEDPSTRDIPVLFMTASSDIKDRMNGFTLGAVDYIVKPFRCEELVARTQVHVDLSQLTKRLQAQIEERIAAESALQKLTQELERRVEERTAELTAAVEELQQAQGHREMVLRAAQAVAGETTLDKLLEQLMRLIVEHAGAQRCILILRRGSDLMIEATITTRPFAIHVNLSAPLQSSTELAVMIAQEVARTKLPVMIWDVAAEARLAAEPHIASVRPKSILCLPLMHQGEIEGVIYLDNATEPITPSRLRMETLDLLSSQTAVAVRNALLYKRLADITAELQCSNGRLENEVARQTEALRVANERLTLELAERLRAEEDRAQLQEEIIRAQTESLKELSTPLIPITEQIMVMPLIGTVSAERARQVLETALHGAHSSRAEVVILDVTGVKRTDAAVAEMLVSTASALRLVGALTVLTGVRGEMAELLVDLGIDLNAIVTKGTLMSGIVYALGSNGRNLKNRLGAVAT